MALIQASFMSECLTRQVAFNVILPTDRFGPTMPKEEPIKALYLLHGVTGSSSFWLTASALGSLSAMHNLAIIMPDGENHFYTDDEDWFGFKWGEYVGKELVEYTRNIFPLSRRREDTLIGGVSMGGYGAILNGLRYPETFGHIVGISNALVTRDVQRRADTGSDGFSRGYFESIFGDLDKVSGSIHDPWAAAEQLRNSGRPLPTIYQAVGTEDFLYPVNQDFRALMEKLAWPDYTYEEGPGGHVLDFTQPHLMRGVALACSSS